MEDNNTFSIIIQFIIWITSLFVIYAIYRFGVSIWKSFNNVKYRYLLLMPIFILLQTLVLNNILFTSYINPLIYLVLIITLPQDIERWFILIYAFLLGISLDILEGNIGLNASSLVFTAFITPYIQKITIPNKSIEEKDYLTLETLGVKTFTLFSFSIILINHLFFFSLEIFNFSQKIHLLFQTISSSFVTYMLILIMQIFSLRKRK